MIVVQSGSDMPDQSGGPAPGRHHSEGPEAHPPHSQDAGSVSRVSDDDRHRSESPPAGHHHQRECNESADQLQVRQLFFDSADTQIHHFQYGIGTEGRYR